jgi:hypothetical protein
VKLPNFFIIGAPKCGTTSLAAWLGEHPNIYFSPIKEPFFFSTDLNRRFITNWADYLELFKDSNDNHLMFGEGSTDYLFSKEAVRTIEKEMPGSRYIVLVRNPVDMAYALHGQQLFSGLEDVRDFKQAWDLSEVRRNGLQVPNACKEPKLLDYQSYCKLGEQIDRLYRIVPKERVLVLVLDDIKQSPRQEYIKVLNFLSLPDDGRLEFPVYNVAKEWHPVWFGEIVKRIKRYFYIMKYEKMLLPKHSLGFIAFLQKTGTNKRVRAPMSDSLRKELTDFFVEDIELLEHIIHRDFSKWRTSSISHTDISSAKMSIR